MRVIEPSQLKHLKKKSKNPKRPKLVVPSLLILLIFSVYVLWASLRSLPLIHPLVDKLPILPASSTAVSWPAYGQAAVGTLEEGLLARNGETKPVSVASITKLITALSVLQKHPLKLNEQGPSITLDATDIGYYTYYASNDGSVVRVVAGEQISEYQALQAILLPSANNMADTLARWAFGSLEAYLSYADTLVQQYGMKNTSVKDASGFTDSTTSTAEDLIILGKKALQHPVIAQIVAQQNAEIPIAGTINSTNALLSSGMIGIKTGNTDRAGGCYLFASTSEVQPGRSVTIIGAVLSAPTLTDAMKSAVPLLSSAKQSFTVATVVKAGQVIGTYSTAWGAKATASSKQDLAVLRWNGTAINPELSMQSIKSPLSAGTQVGTINALSNGESKTSPVELAPALNSPSFKWRLLHPF